MPVKFGQTGIRFWFFLSYLITTVFTVRLGAQFNQRKPMSIRKCSRRRRKASKKAIDVTKFKARVQINALTRTKADIGPALHSSE